MTEALMRRLRAIARDEQILQNEPLAAHTTMRVGGPADVFFLPDSAAQVRQALEIARELGLPALLMGNGSNLIARDGGVRGLVVCLGERFARVEIDGEELRAQAGASLARVASMAQESGLAAKSLPGSSSTSAAPPPATCSA